MKKGMAYQKDTTRFSDHDMLIRLDTKFDNLAIQMKTATDGLATRIVALETKADQVDVYHAKIDLNRFEEDAKWIEGFRSNLKLFIFIGLPIYGAVIAFVSKLISNYLGI